jgi:hypothetical protein
LASVISSVTTSLFLMVVRMSTCRISFC